MEMSDDDVVETAPLAKSSVPIVVDLTADDTPTASTDPVPKSTVFSTEALERLRKKTTQNRANKVLVSTPSLSNGSSGATQPSTTVAGSKPVPSPKTSLAGSKAIAAPVAATSNLKPSSISNAGSKSVSTSRFPKPKPIKITPKPVNVPPVDAAAFVQAAVASVLPSSISIAASQPTPAALPHFSFIVSLKDDSSESSDDDDTAGANKRKPPVSISLTQMYPSARFVSKPRLQASGASAESSSSISKQELMERIKEIGL